MPNITLAISEEVYSLMKKHREMRWSEVARKAIIEEVKNIELIEKIASKSKLTMKDIEEINEKIKKGMHKHLMGDENRN